MKLIKINGVEFKIGIDKITIGLKYPNLPKKQLESPDEQAKKEIIEAQKKFFGEEMYLQQMIVSDNHDKHLMKNKTMRYIIKDEDGNYCFEFHLGQIAGTRIINLQINPSKMSQSAKAELDGLLSVTFYNGYQEFYNRAVISKLELYVDILDVDISEYVLIDLGRRQKTDYENTTYLGKRNSRLTMASYDKAKQLKMEATIHRYECRISNRNLYFKNYIEKEQKNPFMNFVLIAKQDLQLIALKKGGPKFAAKLEDLGLYRATANKFARESIKQELLNCRVSWWDVDIFWNTIIEELYLLKPNNFLTSN